MDRLHQKSVRIKVTCKHTAMHTLCSVFCRFENKLSDLLSWIKTWKTSTQALASTHPESTPDTPDLQEKLKVNLLMTQLNLVLKLEHMFWKSQLKYVSTNHCRVWSWTSQQMKPQWVKWSRRDGAWWTSWREVWRKEDTVLAHWHWNGTWLYTINQIIIFNKSIQVLSNTFF